MISVLKKIKREFKKAIYNLVYFVNFKGNLKNYILFESNPDYTDSPKCVFDKMIEMGINKKYKLIWIVKNKEKFENIKIDNVLFVQRDKKLINKIISFHYIFNAKYIIDCNSCIKKINRRQKRIYLTHGCPIKKTLDYSRNIGKVDYITVPSTWFIDISVKLYNVDESKFALTGMPRDDCFFVVDKNEEKLIKNSFGSKKYIVWLPTYRNHKDKKMSSLFYVDSGFQYGVPILDNSSIYDLNDFLHKNDINLFVKLHPVENATKIQQLKLSNIIFIDDAMLSKINISINQFLKYSIGLLTDYSSVYYDFCNTCRPIGLTISDLDEFTKRVGVLFDYKKEIKGKHIYNYNDLLDYIKEANGNIDHDYYSKLYKKFNDFGDSDSSKRVIDLLDLDLGEKYEE